MNTPIVVKYDERYMPSGATSQVSWHNPDVRAALRQLFHCSPTEVLAGVELSDYGITARFVRDKTAEKG